RDVLADEPLAAPFSQELAEIALNYVPPPGLHQLEQVWRLPLAVTQERWPNLFGMPLHTYEQPVQAGGEVGRTLRRNGLQVCLNTAELFQEHGFEQGGLAREMGVDGLFAHSQSFGEGIHRDAVKAVGEEMLSRSPDDPLPDGPLEWDFGCWHFPA